jgi:hypothetical protein
MSTLFVERPVDAFWAEVAPCDHMVQFYENVDTLVDALDGFIGAGLESGDASILIATPVHKMLLETRLRERGLDLEALAEEGLYVALDASDTLRLFMRGGWPDAELFHKCVTSILARTNSKGRKIRAFGEMVAVLWAGGQQGAVVALEHLWQDFCKKTQHMSLFCAFPKAGFTKDMNESLDEIMAAHSAVFGGHPTRQ